MENKNYIRVLLLPDGSWEIEKSNDDSWMGQIFYGGGKSAHGTTCLDNKDSIKKAKQFIAKEIIDRLLKEKKKLDGKVEACQKIIDGIK